MNVEARQSNHTGSSCSFCNHTTSHAGQIQIVQQQQKGMFCFGLWIPRMEYGMVLVPVGCKDLGVPANRTGKYLTHLAFSEAVIFNLVMGMPPLGIVCAIDSALTKLESTKNSDFSPPPPHRPLLQPSSPPSTAVKSPPPPHSTAANE